MTGHIARVTDLGSELELCRRLGIADFIIVKINQENDFAVFDFAFAEVVQVWLPVAILGEIFGDAL